jgi:DNA-binding SARP family transcriptional activator
MDALWPDDPGNAAHNLHTHLSYLRRALEPHAPPRAPSRYVVRVDDAYRLELRGGSWDAAAFEAEATAGLRALATGEAGAGERLAGALARYRGPLFADRPYLAAAGPLRARLEQLMVDASLEYAALARGRGEFRAAEACLERLLAEDASVEPAYRLLMELAADQDRPERVARIAERCRRALRALLDAEPSPETEATARRLTSRASVSPPGR